MAAPESLLHDSVDGRRVGHALLQQVQRLAKYRELDAVADEPGHQLVKPHRFAPALLQCLHRARDRRLTRPLRSHHFNQWNDVGRIPEMRDEKALRMQRMLEQAFRREAAGAAGDDGALWHDLLEFTIQRMLCRQGLEDRFDDEGCLRQLADI